ncbi:hypothetical protein [Pseudomonas sp. AIG]
MNFTLFNNQNHWLDASDVSHASVEDAIVAFFTHGKHVAYFQAYERAHPQQLANSINTLWTGRPPAIGGQPLITALATSIDTLWTGTIKPQGLLKLQSEHTATNAYFNGLGQCPALDEYAKHGVAQASLHDFKITRVHLQLYAGFLGTLAATHLVETPANKYNRSHLQALKLEEARSALNAGDAVTPDSTYWKKINECADFWIKEVPATRARQAHMDRILAWPKGTTKEVLKRNVSDKEQAYAMETQVVSQGKDSFERHKWFYFKKGSPGVIHGWVLTIELQGKAIEELMGLAVEVSGEHQSTSSHAFIKKQNESDCIGIHEDFLAAFSEHLIKQITSKK